MMCKSALPSVWLLMIAVFTVDILEVVQGRSGAVIGSLRLGGTLKGCGSITYRTFSPFG